MAPQVQGLQVGRLTDSSNGLGVGHQPPGVRGEEASAMEDAWGEANVLLELLLDPVAPGALLKDHLLVDLILSKGVSGDQVGSGRKRPRSVTPQLLALLPPVSPRGPGPQPSSPPPGLWQNHPADPKPCELSLPGLDGPSAPC